MILLQANVLKKELKLKCVSGESGNKHCKTVKTVTGQTEEEKESKDLFVDQYRAIQL